LAGALYQHEEWVISQGWAAGIAPENVAGLLPLAANSLWMVVIAAVGLAFFTAALALLRKALLTGRKVTQAPTWDCGYTQPTARMQYTASSFAQPITHLFRSILRTEHDFPPPAGLFPKESELETTTPDVFRERLFGPAFQSVGWLSSKFRWVQHGRVQLYVLYIAAAIVALLFWKL